MTDSVTETLTPAALQILQVAERLYAEQGVDAVSVRQISREAGQKNHSAVQYHFGSARGLLEAILDFRMIPLNARRQLLLDHWESQGNPDDLAGLVQTLVDARTGSSCDSRRVVPPEERNHFRGSRHRRGEPGRGRGGAWQ